MKGKDKEWLLIKRRMNMQILPSESRQFCQDESPIYEYFISGN